MPLSYALIAGVGPGTGAAIARKFAQAYTVVLLGRTLANLKAVEEEITKAGGKALCVETDVSQRESMEKMSATVASQLGENASCAAAIFNASGRPAWKPFLETSDDDLNSMLRSTCQSGFLFAQMMMPKLLAAANDEPKYPPTLIYTGATAALKGSAMLAPFAMGKMALRGMAQSLAREFGPKGVHVSHVVIDGLIDIPMSAKMLEGKGPSEKISPETVSVTEVP